MTKSNCQSGVFVLSALAAMAFIAACDGSVVTSEPEASEFEALLRKGAAARVTLCHFPPDNPDNPRVLKLPENAAAAHVRDHAGDGIVGEDYDEGCEALEVLVTYDFDHLFEGRPLDRQDNWAMSRPAKNYRHLLVGGGSHDGSRMIRFDSSGPQIRGVASRVNDLNFAFPSFDGTETEAVVQADVRVGHWGLHLWLGTDLNSDGEIFDTGERGPGIFLRGSGTQIAVHHAGGRHTVPNNAQFSSGDWVRVRLTMDLTANGGQGGGSLSVRNLTRGDADFASVTGLQNLNLGLGPTPGATPMSWNGVSVHMEGAGNQMDNIVVGWL